MSLMTLNLEQQLLKEEEKICNNVDRNFNKLTDSYLKKSGIDAHELKKDFLGKNAKITHYDLYKYTNTGEILIL